MCGIALIISGIKIKISSLLPNHFSPSPHLPSETLFSVDDIKEALRRRGPDSLGSKNVLIHSRVSSQEHEIVSEIHDLCNAIEVENDFGFGAGKLEFIGATLQLRGVDRIVQPLVDGSGNVLVYNGEIFGGLDIGSDSNDSEILMQNLGQCCTCFPHELVMSHCSCGGMQNSIPHLLSKIKGPWALIYWQDSSKTLWFGRDALGRRSLLVHWPTAEDPRLLLSSVSPLPSTVEDSVAEFGDAKRMSALDFWEELPCGVYSIYMGVTGTDLVGEVKKHQWADSNLEELIRWERASVQPSPEELKVYSEKLSGRQQYAHALHTIMMHSESDFTSSTEEIVSLPSGRLLIALKESVKRRTALSTIYKATISDGSYEGHAPVSVLFSGGLDSMILAALLHQCIDTKYEIDLLNVSFDENCAPDRISAWAGVKELKKIAPSRRWKLVEIDSDLLSLTSETKHVMSLINPAKTYMDLNIGIALWLAAGGDGWMYEEGINNNSMDHCPRVKYRSNSRILLVGSGADEQCAGYGRHRTKYRNGSWLGLHEEMKLDMQRIWKRNLGRDDRCIADNGKEARFPFLDEDVIKMLLDLPLWEIADLDQPSGIGDKKILREVAKLLGLYEAAVLPKRAIQFGSRIARESNRKNFGSNRAANQASAGSVAIHGPSN